MMKFNNTNKLFFVFLFNILLISIISIIIFYQLNKGKIPPNTFFCETKISENFNYSDFKEILEKIYENDIKNNYLTLNYENIEYKIGLEYIDFRFDYKKSYEKIQDLRTKLDENLIIDYFSENKKLLYPNIKIDEKRLKEKLKEYSGIIDIEPVYSDVFISDKKVITKKRKVGYKISQNNIFDKIKKELPKTIINDAIINIDSKTDIKKVNEIEKIDYSKFEYIISFYNTKILERENLDVLKKGVEKLNKTIIKSNKYKNNIFSFQKVMGNEIFEESKNNEASHIASTLNATVLTADISKDINKKNNEYTVDYIKEGLDVKVDKNNDYKFKNYKDNDFIILSNIIDNTIEIYIISKKEKVTLNNLEIKKQITQKNNTIYVEDINLLGSQKVVGVKGKYGIKAEVNLIKYEDGTKKKEQLFTNIYTPLEEIIYIPRDSIIK
ncbi:MAG: hypothetical protein ABF289_04035 [Clostridiales bacterium]